jgi:transcription initiation factor TFIID subunit 7
MSGKGPRPILKLKVASGASAAGSPPSQTPTASTPKLKLKLGSSTQKAESPSTAEPSPKIKIKAPKKPRPKKLSTKKRDHGDGDEDGQAETSAAAGIKKIKLTQKPKTPSTPYIKIKGGNRPFHRPRGQAYDEIASDREDDPLIEEDFILRMLPGEDCDYVREACEKRSWGPRSKGGADVRLKFLTSDGRRAILTVRTKMYACALVDLPSIIEGVKSWDRKSWYKSADIFQMLMVLGVIQNESEAMEYPIPQDVDKKTMAYAHGLTPPMRWVRKRRFRKRISLKTIEAVEAEVERLLELDDEAEEATTFEFLDPNKLSRGTSGQDTPRSDDEYEEVEVVVDADGNEIEMGDYFDDANGEEDEDALAAQFELAMQEGDGDLEAETPADSSTAAAETQNVTDSERATPAAGHTSKDEDSGDDSGDDDDLEEMDDDAREQRADDQRQREEIADLEVAIREQTAEMEKMSNAILKRKKAEKIQSLKEELELKKAAIGEGEDD